MLGVAGQPGQGHLVGPERALDLHAVDDVGPRPALRGAQHDHRPLRTTGLGLVARPPGRVDLGDLVEAPVERVGQQAVDCGRLVAGHDVHAVAVALEQPHQLVVGDAGQHGRVGDLVPVEVQDRQHGPVDDRVEELVRVPGGGERSGLGLAVAHHARHHQVGVVEGRAVRVDQGVAQLAALVDRTGRLGGGVAGDAARERELAEQAAHALLVLPDLGVDLAVGALEPGVGHHAGAAVAGAADVDHVGVAGADDAVEVGVDQVEPRGGAPVAEQAGLHVLEGEGLVEQGVGEQVDLPDREVVGGAPPGVDELEVGVGRRPGRGDGRRHGVDGSTAGRRRTGAAGEHLAGCRDEDRHLPRGRPRRRGRRRPAPPRPTATRGCSRSRRATTGSCPWRWPPTTPSASSSGPPSPSPSPARR